MPRGGPCNHRSCADYGEGCRQLTDEELKPTPADDEYVRDLIARGYYQISAKYRRVLGPLSVVPMAEELIKPEALETPAGRELADLWNNRHRRWYLGQNPKLGEEITLTVRQFASFKKQGGQCL